MKSCPEIHVFDCKNESASTEMLSLTGRAEGSSGPPGGKWTKREEFDDLSFETSVGETSLDVLSREVLCFSLSGGQIRITGSEIPQSPKPLLLDGE